ncbi:Cytoplasmic GTPase/eEF2-like protein (ribosomal biogenesis) [Tulasnella sp. 418]|nr:Cytoplasmic GTPase/eEF2-like protein (ribosomal biogenesis) [Tulasnella sp. 418]
MTDSREQVRVITTIGHVDHGKTTFVDSLLVANNIISARMAGKIRYMDSREDEQQRGITMESSAVSLRFKMLRKSTEGQEATLDYVINLIDTPGHVDFSSEVSTAARLCDGALVLVDVVEGVCTQTIAVLRQAWIDGLRPILVINKFDRLITELKLAPIEAYHHLTQLIEQVNAVMGSFFASERMEDDLRWREERERRLAQRKDATADQVETDVNSGSADDKDSSTGMEEQYEEKDDEDLYFSPERGNVIFASAIDGWGFRIGKFAQLYAQKLGIKELNLRRVLWGDFYLDPKTKRVINYKHLKGRNLKPLFVQFVLENIWAVYENVVINPNPDKVAKIVTTLNLKILPRDLRSKDHRYLLSLIFSQWLSLSTCTFQAVVDIIPPPSIAQRTRIPKMLYPDLSSGGEVKPRNKLEEDLYGCKDDEKAYVVAYVSKMFAVQKKEMPENQRKALTAEEMRAKGREAREARLAAATDNASDLSSIPLESLSVSDEKPAETSAEAPVDEDQEVLLGFARLYSGTITKSSNLYCVLPKYNASLPPSHPSNSKHVSIIKITGLYVMMGRDLVPADKIRAGNVFAVTGLEGIVWRNGTLCGMGSDMKADDMADIDSARGCMVNLAGVNRQAAPIVRVALEPAVPADMPKLIHGLKLLVQADPCVESFQQQTGEHVILTAGELHLERCLKDLRERFAKIEIQASPPIVPFRETAVRAPDMALTKTPNAPRGTIHSASAYNMITFTIRAVPLPESITSFLLSNVSIIKRLHRQSQGNQFKKSTTGDDLDDPEGEAQEVIDGEVVRQPTVKLENFWTTLEELFKSAGSEWAGVVDRIWSFGPHRIGPNILVDKMGGFSTSMRKRLQRELKNSLVKSSTPAASNVATPEASVMGENRNTREYDDNIETGFQIATSQGPLCAEPVQGMACFVENIHLNSNNIAAEGDNVYSRVAQIRGSLISAVKDACKTGLLDWSPRLMLAMYTCDIQASTDVLGRVYSVVAKRKGRIISEEMKEGTTFFTIRALLPVVESFGFADDIRKRTSGAASPQLIFSGYEMLDQDPFWVPTTEEELEDLGEKADRANVARGYMDAVRKRKGMFVDKKIVEFAEKQRTLKK